MKIKTFLQLNIRQKIFNNQNRNRNIQWFLLSTLNHNQKAFKMINWRYMSNIFSSFLVFFYLFVLFYLGFVSFFWFVFEAKSYNITQAGLGSSPDAVITGAHHHTWLANVFFNVRIQTYIMSINFNNVLWRKHKVTNDNSICLLWARNIAI